MNVVPHSHKQLVSVAFALALALAISGGPRVAGAEEPPVPQTIDVSGRTLALNGHAVRNKLFGLVDLYSVALYLPEQMPRSTSIGQRDVAKAIRVEVLYDGSIPDKIPQAWSEELLPVLSTQASGQLRRTYAGLRSGDVIVIRYAPERGTEVVVGKTVAIADPGQELMAAFLDIWAGQNAISEDMRRALLNGRQ